MTTEIVQYISLNDAVIYCSELTPGETEIWYAHQIYLSSEMIDPNNLTQTHTLIGKIKETDLETIFYIMQGEQWSPHGEAQTLIGTFNSHTSMCVGDVVVLPDKTVHYIDIVGFKVLPQ